MHAPLAVIPMQGDDVPIPGDLPYACGELRIQIAVATSSAEITGSEFGDRSRLFERLRRNRGKALRRVDSMTKEGEKVDGKDICEKTLARS